MNIEALKAFGLSVRALSMDGVQAANSGHPGLPMGCADLGAVLYGAVLKHDPSHPTWADRDRFILSAGHGSMFLYSLLHLTGYDLPLEEVKKFRQIGSKTPGHPEYGLTSGVETTTGPLGAGFANAVGFAVAETKLAAEFNTPTHKIVDHFTYVLSGDGCMMEGVTSEAASLAGHLGLGKLIVFYDSNRITIEGHTDIAFTEDVGKRYEAYGWQVLKGSAFDHLGMASLVDQAKKATDKPTLIILESIIGFGSPNKAGSHEVHGAPLGGDEIKATRRNLGIPEDQDFFIHPEAKNYISGKQPIWTTARRDWESKFASWAQANPELKARWDLFHNPAEALKSVVWPSYKVGDSLATRVSGGKALNAVAAALPGFMGGSADLAPSNNTNIAGGGDFQKATPMGRNMHYGVREHAMGAVVNGMVLHGGIQAYGATFLVFSDYMRPPLRLSALMKIPSLFIFTHDSIFVGEDGPTHQPVEHYALLRAIPNHLVLRPGDAEETNAAWELALSQKDRPTSFLLTRQNLKVYPKPADWKDSFKKGGYIAQDSEGNPETVVLATGSEVNLALEALALSPKKVRVISVSSLELLKANPEHYKSLVPAGVRVVAAECGISMGWDGLITPGAFLGMSSFGESGPGASVAKHFGLTAENLAKLF